MPEDFIFHADVDPTQANAKLDQLDAKTENTKRRVVEVEHYTEQATKRSFQKVLGMAQMSWGVMDATLRAFGVNVSMQTRLLIRSGFAAIRVLTPIFTAQALTPTMAVQAGLGMFNLALAFQAIEAAKQGEMQAATQIAAGTEALTGLSSLIGMMNFL